MKRPTSKPAPVEESRGRSQPEAADQEVPLPEHGAAPPGIAAPDPAMALLRNDELLSLEDHAVAEPVDGSTGIAAWRRGLRG